MRKLYFSIIDNNVVEFSENQEKDFVPYEFRSVLHLQRIFIGAKIKIELSIINEIEELYSDIEEDNTLEEDDFTIKHWVNNRSYGELAVMFEGNEIVKPDMQRNFIWSNNRCNRFVESIIKGLPIPSVFLMDMGKGKFEIVDGFQRITAITNFIYGRPWTYNSLDPQSKKTPAAKVTFKYKDTKISKSFSQLDKEFQLRILRSTIPVIEFQQQYPKNNDSKYMIFERINTGSEKLTPMQIRKSLSAGPFLKELYLNADKNDKFINFFTYNSRQKDNHVEAYLRIYALSTDFYLKAPTVNGMLKILNNFCESHKDSTIDEEYQIRFDKAIDKLFSIFGKDIFKRPLIENDEVKYIGNLNTPLMESLMAVCINEDGIYYEDSEIKQRYDEIIDNIYKKSEEIDSDSENPFSISTGAPTSIVSRVEIARSILIK